MKVFFSVYHLTPSSAPNAATSLKPRQGALLRFEWVNGKTGYADLHPWPEFGDAPLFDQLQLLKELKLTPLTEQSIWLAKRDAAARSKGESLFVPGVQLKNNYLIENPLAVMPEQLDQLADRGFSTLKIKCGRDLEEEAKLIQKIALRRDFRMRLDFNGVGTATIFEKFMKGLGRETTALIEYVEDPFPYEKEEWREARALARLALDFQNSKVSWNKEERPACDVVIVKPARMDVEKTVEAALHWAIRISVSSSMDHPVGVAHALCVALDLKKKHDLHVLEAGCMTTRLYQMDAFATAMPHQGPYFIKFNGTGVGFDSLLERAAWKPLADL